MADRTPLAAPKPKRKTRQDRKSNHATMSLSWETFDELGELADLENASLGRTIAGLIKYYKQHEAEV